MVAMIGDICLVKNDPPNSYGDCLRACIASLLELPTVKVPHFVRDGCAPEVTYERVREWLADRGLVPMFNGYTASETPDDVLKFMAETNPGVYYILFSADHAVVCLNDEIVHDPAWVKARLVPPSDMWITMVLTHDCR